MIKLHLSKIQKKKRSVYEFVDYVFELIRFISQARMDPVMSSIASETQFLLKHLKTNYGESSDYMSDSEEEEEEFSNKFEIRKEFAEDEGKRFSEKKVLLNVTEFFNF